MRGVPKTNTYTHTHTHLSVLQHSQGHTRCTGTHTHTPVRTTALARPYLLHRYTHTQKQKNYLPYFIRHTATVFFTLTHTPNGSTVAKRTARPPHCVPA